jgi:hypothetical protein
MGAIVRGRRADFIAVFEGREPVARPSFGTGELTGLTVDRRRRRLLVLGNEIQGMLELDDPRRRGPDLSASVHGSAGRVATA